MNSLLKRQIRKYLPKDLQSNKDLEVFFDAINRSYETSNDQFAMLQRATTLSSEELFNANTQLKEETDSQKKVIKKLETVIDKLQVYDLNTNRPKESIDSLQLVDFIDNQTNEIIKINQQKDKLLQSLERQNKELNDYTHMVSHDLKSPLQSIDALTTWIQNDYEKVIDDNGKESLKLIRENVEKMDTLVKGILEYSTIGKKATDFYELELDVLVQDVLKTITKPNHVAINIPQKLPIINGDKYRLEQLFYHLIQNAIKFNDKEKGIIEIGFSDKKTSWEFYVKDNGKGIEQQYFDKIFIAFQKLENDYKSTGIGLAIVKKIIDLYQGEIWVTSELHVGSTFYFKIKK